MEKTLVISDIGQVRLVKSDRARYVSITIKPFTGVRVAVPKRVSYREAEKIVRQKSAWIKKHLPRINQIESRRTVFSEESKFSTREHTLKIRSSPIDHIQIKIENQQIEITYPDSTSVESDAVQSAVREGITEALRFEAKKHLPSRVLYFAEKYNLSYHNVFIKNTRSRWGSCSHKNNINLSLHLMRIPERLIDYIILHELAHTRVKNHSAQYWQYLEQICPNSRTLDAEMRNWSLSIF